MIYEQKIVHRLYRKLLTLYPQTFKEQLGESMEQTFRDLYIERRRQTDRGVFGFVIWMFIETVLGILRERLILIREGETMQTILANLRLPAAISFLITVPFIILEVVNRRNFNEGFPIPLFIIMWLAPILFILAGMPIVRNVRAGNGILANSIVLLIRIVFLVLLASFWVGLVIDQMPCFLGVPNCD